MEGTMKNVYFLSDAHLGSRAIPHRRTQERRLVNFLDSIKHHASAVYLLGDMFDFWYEFKLVVPKGYTRFLGKLSELTDLGVEIHFFIGNHDIWLRDYLVSGLCPPVWIDSNGGARTVKDFIRSGVSGSERVMMGEWLSMAPYVRIDEHFIVIHGGIPQFWTMTELEKIASLSPSTVGYAAAEDPASSPLWNRSYLQSAMAFEKGADPAVLQVPLDTSKRIFIGHTPINQPFHSERYHLTAVDTGAGHGRKLTVMDMDTYEYWQAGNP